MNGSGGGTCRSLAGGLLALGLTCFLAGCAAAPPPTAAPPVQGPAQVVPLGSDEIAARIRELELQLQKRGTTDPGGELSREQALLYTHPLNRSPDHGKALALMRVSLSSEPRTGTDLEAERLVALLEAIDRLGRLLREARQRERDLSGQVEASEQRERELKNREQRLLAEIQSLRARIDKLKALDLEMEKRRKSVR